MFTVWIYFLAFLRMWAPPFVASWLLAELMQHTGLLDMPVAAWVASFPLIYVTWLIILLLCCCADTFIINLFIKVPDVSTRAVSLTNAAASSLVVGVGYARCFFLGTIPLTGSFMGLRGFRQLILFSYSPGHHLSISAKIATLISDPGITFIGAETIIGGNAELVAHSFVRMPDGSGIFKRAPIRIGKRVTIGGNSRIELGVTVGDCAMIEPCSHVPAYTRIGEGEVWAGNPAVFVRRRETVGKVGAPEQAVRPEPQANAVPVDKVLPVVAHALNLSLEKIAPETRASDLIEWDSLGKIAIATALHDRFGLELAPEQIFEIDSVADILSALENRARPDTKTNSGSTESPLSRHMELLPLCDPALATVALSSHRLPDPISGLRICVAATTVAEPIAPTLRLWCSAFGIKPDLVFAGFNQVHACLLQPDSIFAQNRAGLNVVIARAEDLTGSASGDLTIRAEQLLVAIENFAQKAEQPIWIADLPPMLVPDPLVDSSELHFVRAMWTRRLEAHPQVRLLPFARIVEELGLTASANHAGDTTIAYSGAAYQRLGVETSRAARQFRVAPRKVLALDADDTLWKGILAEDGSAGLEVTEAHRRLQEFCLALKKKGVLLALVSRNEPDDIWAFLEQSEKMVLRRGDFAAFRINWQPKSENLADIARELRLGLDAFVFIDDNPSELMDVQSHCPEVLLLQASQQPATVDLLQKLWCFDSLGRTKEDQYRTELIQQESQRQETLKAYDKDYARYLKSLQLKVETRLARREDMSRVAQLTQKTNQFNLSLRRRTEGDLSLLPATSEIRIISATDRYGDYGTVGVGILVWDKERTADIILDSFMISCRALGRGIETAFLQTLFTAAVRHGAVRLKVPFVQGPRNQPILDFFKQHGCRFDENKSGELMLPLPLVVPEHIDLTTRE